MSAPCKTIILMQHRIQDWIHGVRTAEPDKETKRAIENEPLYEAERLRIIYQLITNPQSEGGAGITPKKGEWKNVESIFALHDHAYNKEWIKKWTTSYFLKAEDLDDIRNRLGEKVSFFKSTLNMPLPHVSNINLDCVLFCLYAILLHIPRIPRSLRFFCLAAAGTLLVHLCHRELPLVCCLYRVLEAPGGGSGHTMGRQRCIAYRAKAQAIQG
jgi:hypothetical protein